MAIDRIVYVSGSLWVFLSHTRISIFVSCFMRCSCRLWRMNTYVTLCIRFLRTPIFWLGIIVIRFYGLILVISSKLISLLLFHPHWNQSQIIGYSEVPNRRADLNKRAGLEKSATLLAYLLSKLINEQGGIFHFTK